MTMSQIRTAFNLIRKALGAKMTNLNLLPILISGSNRLTNLRHHLLSIIKEGAGGRRGKSTDR